MQLSRTKIDRFLSTAQRKTLCDWLLERSANPTGTLVETGLRELGMWEDAAEPSPASINEWLNKSLAFEVQRRALAEDAAAARTLAESSGEHIAAANKQMLDAELFAALRARRSGEEVDPKALVQLAECAAMTARTLQQSHKTDSDIRVAEAKLAEYAAREEERKAKKAALQATLDKSKAKGGITPETMKLVEEAIGLL